MKQKLSNIDKELLSEEVWTNLKKIKELQKFKADIVSKIEPLDLASEKIAYIEESLNVLNEEEGFIFWADIKKEIEDLRKSLYNCELRLLFSEEIDKNNAIITIHPGAGGVESQDWAQMLMRMYIRWAENKGFNVEMIDYQIGDEAGTKGVTFSINGKFAFGYLKGDSGVHRLVRISPFDSNKRRHTSFSAVFVSPEIDDSNEEINVRDEDLKIDAFRASGAGGQHVNKVSSAIRITHLPTGIVINCQSERSQIRNKELAMKVLKSRLYELQIRQKEKRLKNITADKKDISWGNQIRSYILQPYRLVKDHRTNIELHNVDSILDGAIDIFIEGYLKYPKNLNVIKKVAIAKDIIPMKTRI